MVNLSKQAKHSALKHFMSQWLEPKSTFTTGLGFRSVSSWSVLTLFPVPFLHNAKQPAQFEKKCAVQRNRQENKFDFSGDVIVALFQSNRPRSRLWWEGPRLKAQAEF